ncbi:GAF domain-containing protein [Microbacterium luticocti]|uniref:sensor histidine kinase n=1 Tax=Microbacterium luticocti TaxID=451764 RepID=UPI00041EE41B|nr:GAF domain-containing protein [Microbacterium luticocti]
MDDSALQFPDVPHAQLEKTIGDLIARAEHVLTVQGRLRRLLAANRAVVEALDLDRVLARVVDAAVALVDAGYGALRVVDGDGELERFVHVGMTGDEVDAIGHLPAGHGLLAAVIDTGQTIRLARLSDDPRSVGLPDAHPPMNAFLGVPLRVRDEIYGVLYLADRREDVFSEEDEEVIESLAASAGIAIENARLYDEAQRRQRLSEALSEIAAALLAPGGGDVLGVVAERVALVVSAALVTVVVPGGDADSVRIEVARGVDAGRVQGATLPAASSLAARAMNTGTVAVEPRVERELTGGSLVLGPTVAVPLVVSGRAIGALCVSRAPGEAGFTHAELDTVAEFAAQAGIAISLAWARADRQRLDVLEDRSRIARDLHDHVIQRLFATGLGLQALAEAEPAVAERLGAHVDDIDAAIADIRTAIFTLRSRSATGGAAARHRMLDVVAALTPTLPAPPRITFTGPVDLVLTGVVADDVVAVLREALANVARHAHADHVSVDVTVGGSELTVTVVDDGVGIAPDAARTGGTANLAERAAGHGGTLTVARADGGGTRLCWRVPLRA